ncbi:hypothetical protein V3C99_006145 [Haemonchus contortus]
MRAFLVPLCTWLPVLAHATSYPYSWSIGDVTLTCELGNPGWKLAGTSCFYPFLTRNQSWYDANQMCRNYIFGHSYGTTLQGWLIARSLLKLLPPGIYWTGLSTSENRNNLSIIWKLIETSIYNPIWATDEPHWSVDPFGKCVALDLRSEASVGWRLLNCTERLPALCETFACMGDEFRCLDNSRCIPGNAVRDGIIDCGDESDERAPPMAVGIKKGPKFSVISRNDCQNVIVDLPEGMITSPNYPGNYSERTFCRWDIRAQPGQILIINVEDIVMAPGDTLLLEGNNEHDKFALKSGNYPFSYISKSSRIQLRFVSGANGIGRGFLLRYYSRKSADVCRVTANNVTYESWRDNYDCVYTLHSPDPTSVIVLEIYPSSIGERAMITFLFDKTVHSLKDLRTTQILVIPSNTVRVQVRNAWISKRYTAFYIQYRFIGQEPLKLPLNLSGFTFDWYPTDDRQCISHTLRLVIQSSTKFLPHTLTIDGRLSTDDAITVVKDGTVTHLSSSFRNFRMQNLLRPLHILITKRSTDFRISLKFSRDCPFPREPHGVRVLSPSGRHLGSIIRFSCVNNHAQPVGALTAECLTGGAWSAEPPVCRETMTIFCPLPLIRGGYPLDVRSSCKGNVYCDGAVLRYGCDFGHLPGIISTTTCKNGRWAPAPFCTNATCSGTEIHYLNATLIGDPPLKPLIHANYSPPDWSLTTYPFRVCAMNEFKDSYHWVDYNFAFNAPICRSYPLEYGHFEKPFYQNNETATVICLDGFTVDEPPRCLAGNWTSYNTTCRESPIPANACQNGRVEKLNPGYTCECNSGFELHFTGSIFTCEDIDECLRHFDLCDPDAFCLNRIGGYTCECSPGKELYVGELQEGQHHLIPNISCIWTLCEFDSHLFQKHWITVDQKRHYRHNESIRVLCEAGSEIYAEFEAKCLLGDWIFDRDPCGQKCPKNLHDPDLTSGSGQATLLEHLTVSCNDPNKAMIGSEEIVCGRGGRWLSRPVCRDLHCPNLDGLLSPWLAVTYSDDKDKNRVGTWVSFRCRNGSLQGPRTIECKKDGKYSAKWSKEPPTCVIANNDTHIQVSSSITYEESIISSEPYIWTHSVDWARYNSTWISTTRDSTYSYLLSPAIHLKTDSLRLVVHIQRIVGSVVINTYSSQSPFIPPNAYFVTAASTSKPGFLEVTLDDLGGYLWISIYKTGTVAIESIKLLYSHCDTASIDGALLTRSLSFSKPRRIPVRCGTSAMHAVVTAVCHPVTGWALQMANPCCNQCPYTLRDTNVNCTYTDCANGQCIIDQGKKQCRCLQDFHHKDGECVPDSCTHTFCSKTGQGYCEEKNGTGTCHCGADFSGSRFCEMKNGVCPTCQPDYSCLRIVGRNEDAAQHECVCAADGIVGKCRWDPCRSHNCGPHGKCIPNNDTAVGYSCECEPGWVGEECRSHISCVSTENHYLCKNGGTCVVSGEKPPTCRCSSRFTGATCEIEVNRCEGEICQNGGTCKPTQDGFFCHCKPGFTGLLCENQIDQCAVQNPCQQGQCVQEGSHIKCDCKVGWTGQYCEIQLDLCKDENPCQHGDCLGGLPGTRICDCGVDYRGESCEERITYCQLKPCLNNGTCVERFADGYSCECHEDFTGANCETEIDLCAEWPCDNGGTCVVQDHRPFCHCRAGFTGEHCQTDISHLCDNVTCLHGGTCYVHDAKAFCQCPPDYTGIRCETFVDLCADFTCENDGVCVIADHEAKCQCQSGFGGIHCEKELTECEEFPEPLECLNGGTCIVTNHQQHCECSIDFFGTNCEVFGRSCAVITCNGGTCVNDTNLQGHCICPPERTGEFCETEKTSSFNLYFNGEPSSQKIVSRDFPSTLLREFTLCGWVFYAPYQLVTPDSDLGAFVQLNTTSGSSILSIDNTGVTINNNFHIPAKLYVMAWHHVCVRSPHYVDQDRPTWTIFLDGVFAANASYEVLKVSADIRCLIQIGANDGNRFRGEISLVQLYIAYMDDMDIAKMAFQCRDWMTASHPDLHIKQWTDFTTVQRNNPGVIALYPGLCDVSDCLPGRSSCNTKDKIQPIVRSCPRNIRKVSSNRLTRVDWDTTNMFTDNVGVVSVKSNYRSGQSLTWGYYRVVYEAKDAAGNNAVCSFSVVVSPSECKAPEADKQLEGKLTVEPVNGTDAMMSARISCSDAFFPRNDPEFYVCDVMGQWDRSMFVPANHTYSFPSCGTTQNPVQNINGSLGDYGNCSLILQNLRDWLLKDLWPYCSDLNCTGQLWIDSNCSSTADLRLRRSIREAFYDFRFYANVNNTRTLLKDTIGFTLQKQFPNASLSISDTVVCDEKFPRLSTANGNASCADCPAGQYFYDNACINCPADTFRTRDDPLEKCIPCPKDKTTGGQTGQKDPGACHELCDAGEFYDDETKKCQLCPLGTYQEKPGGAACLPCPSDSTTSITGAKNATDCSVKCDAGEELVADSTNCVPCARGTYWVTTTMFTGCIDCPQGLTTVSTASKDIRDCEVVDCPPGTHVNLHRRDPIDAIRTAFDALCTRCEMGTYQDDRNKTTCKPCTPSSDCPLINECSPLLPDTCAEGNNCELRETGIYSCSTVMVKPTSDMNEWVLWIVVPLVAVLILATLAVTAWIYRHTLYMMMCCKKPDFKLFESTDYYRSPVRIPMPRRSTDHSGYRTYPHRRQDSVGPHHTFNISSAAPRAVPSEHMSGPRFRGHHLPPPIITSKAELDLLEEQARRKTVVTEVFPLSSRSVGSQVVNTGYSSDSPGPSISAQMPRPRVLTHLNGPPPLTDLPEDPSSSYSLYWSESTPDATTNDAYADDDDEDYFG